MSHSELESTYFGAFIILLLATCSFCLITFLSSKISKKLANRNTQRLKLGFYECGPTTVKQPNKINIHYFFYGILFDVEVIFMYPWAVDFRLLGIFGLIEMLLFVAILLIGFAYAWQKGVFKWQSIR